MNRKTRKVIEDLKTALIAACAQIDGEFNSHDPDHDLAIAAAEKLLRGNWTMRGGVRQGTIGRDTYQIEIIPGSPRRRRVWRNGHCFIRATIADVSAIKARCVERSYPSSVSEHS